MKVMNVRVNEVAEEIFGQCIENGNALMDDVVIAAKRKCPVRTMHNGVPVALGEEYVSEGWETRLVSFIPKTGPNKGQRVEFTTDKAWKGRVAGSLRNTIRRVNSPRKRGSIRVYAGNFKIYYALFVEKGTVKMQAQPFLQPTFHAMKPYVLNELKNGR